MSFRLKSQESTLKGRNLMPFRVKSYSKKKELDVL